MRLVLTYDTTEGDDGVEFMNFVNIGTNVEIRTHTHNIYNDLRYLRF